MTDLADLKNRARPTDYASMEALARAALDAGQSPDEMLRTCYGVSFPAEVHVVDAMRAADRELPALHTNQPWSLLSLARGAPEPFKTAIGEIEQQALGIDDRLIPLMIIEDDGALHGGWFVCYRRDELAAGRATIVGLVPDFWERKLHTVHRIGDSLTSVLHEHFANAVQRLGAAYDAPYNQGAGSVEEGEVDVARELLARADELARTVASRQSG